MEKVGISPFIDTKAHELFGSGRIICKGIAFTGKFRFNGIAKIFQVDRYINEFYIYKKNLLAPSGALVVIMVYYVHTYPATHFFKFFKFFRF